MKLENFHKTKQLDISNYKRFYEYENPYLFNTQILSL